MRVEVKRRYGYEPTEQIAYDLGTSLKHVKTIARNWGLRLVLSNGIKLRQILDTVRRISKTTINVKRGDTVETCIEDEPAVIKYIDDEQEKRILRNVYSLLRRCSSGAK